MLAILNGILKNSSQGKCRLLPLDQFTGLPGSKRMSCRQTLNGFENRAFASTIVPCDQIEAAVRRNLQAFDIAKVAEDQFRENHAKLQPHGHDDVLAVRSILRRYQGAAISILEQNASVLRFDGTQHIQQISDVKSDFRLVP